MAPRANWKGYLKLSLVSCAVALYPASTASNRVSFHTMNRDTGNRLRRVMVDEVTGDAIPNEEQVKGYEISKGDYVLVEDDELDAVTLESTHTIDIERFVPREQIDELYLDSPYYIAPDDTVAEEAFAVIREAMHEKGVVGLARVVLFRRERIVMLEPRGKGLFACVLRYPYEIRQDEEYFEAIPDTALPPDMIDLAGHIIDRMQGDFEPETFHDRYEEALVDLLRAKQAGRAVPTAAEAPRPSNVVSLIDALRRSVASDSALGPVPAKATDGRKHPAEKSSRPAKAASSGDDAKAATEKGKGTGQPSRVTQPKKPNVQKRSPSNEKSAEKPTRSSRGSSGKGGAAKPKRAAAG